MSVLVIKDYYLTIKLCFFGVGGGKKEVVILEVVRELIVFKVTNKAGIWKEEKRIDSLGFKFYVLSERVGRKILKGDLDFLFIFFFLLSECNQNAEEYSFTVFSFFKFLIIDK